MEKDVDKVFVKGRFMARFDDKLISCIKSEVGLLWLIKEQGYSFKKQGRDYVMCCPFHDDKTPSLVITPHKNLWHCLGACNQGGSVIDWLMKTESLDFRAAVERLQPCLPGAVSLDSQPKAEQTPISSLAATAANTTITPSEDDQTLLKQVFSHYHHTLKSSDKGLAYLEQRGLADPELIEYFQLGYADQSLMRTLPNRSSSAGHAVRQQLQALGLVRESGHEFFKGSIVVPVLSDTGDVQQAYGRKLIKKSAGNPVVHRYLPAPLETVWHSEAVQNTREIILCESLVDAMTFWVNGFKPVLASFGTNGFSDAHEKLLIESNIQRVLIAYDNDLAGNKAAEELAQRLQQQGLACFRVQFPKKMDVNEYAVTVKPAAKSLALVISKAVYMGEGEAPPITSLHDQTVLLDDVDLQISRAIAQQTQVAQPQATSQAVIAAKEKEPEEQSESVTVVSDNEQTTSHLAADAVLDSLEEVQELLNSPINTVSNTDQDNVEVSGKEIIIHYESRRYRVRGLQKNNTYEQLKINLLASHNDQIFIDNLDLYSAKQRSFFIKQSALELGLDHSLIKSDMGKLLCTLEDLQNQHINDTLAVNEQVTLTPQEEREALTFLRHPNLLENILNDFTACGVVGESVNKLVGFLAVTSRQLNKPLAVVIQSSSAAGKSALMESILAFVPEESRVQFSAMSAQSLFYMGQTNLKNKVLAIAEEEGAHNASYALKLLQSEGKITMASTGKNESTGQLETQSYEVEGPIMLFFTTTAIDVDEELLNRCLVLTVNESREQTKAIHKLQRESQTLEGLLRTQQKQLIEHKHQNAQRLLTPLAVVNPFANQLTFLADKTRTRRDHMKYLQLINAVTFLHQYQREIKTVEHQGNTVKYIEATLSDIEIANDLAHAILGRSLDELPPQTRKLLDGIYAMVTDACKQEGMPVCDYRFSRKQIREASGWGNTQLKLHCKRLEEMEYLLVHQGRRGQSMVYELLYQPLNDDQDRQLMGLIDTGQLNKNPKNTASLTKKSGVKGEKSGPSRPQVGAKSAPSRGVENTAKPENTGPSGHLHENSAHMPIKSDKNHPAAMQAVQ